MRGVGMQYTIAIACSVGLFACNKDSSNDDSNMSGAGTGVVSADDAGKGGSGAEAGGSGGEGGAGGSAAVGDLKCMNETVACALPTQQTDGVPCCTATLDTMPYYTSRTVDTCGLKFPTRLPCFELHAPGTKDDECPQNLDQGWGHHDGCCHAVFHVCGIINDDTGCTLYKPTALKADGTMIGGMGSGDYKCTPD